MSGTTFTPLPHPLKFRRRDETAREETMTGQTRRAAIGAVARGGQPVFNLDGGIEAWRRET